MPKDEEIWVLKLVDLAKGVEELSRVLPVNQARDSGLSVSFHDVHQNLALLPRCQEGRVDRNTHSSIPETPRRGLVPAAFGRIAPKGDLSGLASAQ